MRYSILLVFAVVQGCAVPPSVPVTKIIGDRDAIEVNDERGSLLGHDERFARDIAKQRLAGSMDATVGNWQLRGIYIGPRDKCEAVNIRNVTLSRSSNYLVCGDDVRQIVDVAPAFPRAGALTRAGTAQAAWVNGRATQMWEGYNIQAVTIGPVRSNGCALVQTTVSYQGMLVDQSQDTICKQ